MLEELALLSSGTILALLMNPSSGFSLVKMAERRRSKLFTMAEG